MNFMPPPRPKCYIIYLFCVIYAASVRRLKSLPKSGLLLINKKEVIQVVNFARKVLKTKVLMDIWLGLHIFFHILLY